MASETSEGHDAASPFAIPAGGWWAILKRTYAQASDDNLGLIAAGVAFFGFLALVPLLGALVLTYGLIVDPAEIARHFASIAQTMPRDVAKLIGDQLTSLITTSADKKGLGLLASLALAVYGAMKGAGAIVTALNIAYEESDKRGMIGGVLINAAITSAAVFLGVMLLAAASAGQALEAWLGDMPILMKIALQGVAWVVALIVTMLGLAALYRYGPSRANARWRWLSAGALFATLGLVGASIGFARYTASLGNYNATYGSLGAVVVLLLWLYISAYVLLLGAELNAEIEHQTAVDTTTGKARPIGERKAVMADEVAS
jgi:membrane protein